MTVLLPPGHEHSWVTDQIAVGSGVWSDRDVWRLHVEGITHVIDCRDAPAGEILFRELGSPHYFHVGTADDGVHKPPEYWHRGFDVARHALARVIARPRLLICCAAGVNRSPCMAYGVLRTRGLSAPGAERAIRMARPIVRLRYLRDVERAVHSWTG